MEANRQAVTKRPCARPGLETARVRANRYGVTKSQHCLARASEMAGKVKSPSVTRASRSPSWPLDGPRRSMFMNVANRLGDCLGQEMAGAR